MRQIIYHWSHAYDTYPEPPRRPDDAYAVPAYLVEPDARTDDRNPRAEPLDLGADHRQRYAVESERDALDDAAEPA